MPDFTPIVKAGAEVIGKLVTLEGAAAKNAITHLVEEGFAKAPGTVPRLDVEALTSEIVRGDTATGKTAFRWPAETDKDKLVELLSHNPSAQARLNDLDWQFHSVAARMVARDPETLPLLEEQLTNGTAIELLRPMRLLDLAELRKTLAPHVYASTLALEGSNKDVVHGVRAAINTPDGKALVERLLRDGAPAEHFDNWRLAAQQKLEKQFGVDSIEMRRMLELESTSGLKLQHASDLEHPELIKSILASDNAAARINLLGQPKSPYITLARTLRHDPSTIEKAESLAETKGLSITKINQFIDGSPQRAKVVVSELERGATVSQLHARGWLPGLELVKQHLGSEPDLVGRTIELAEHDKLNMWQLGDYLDGNPTKRVPAIKQLLEKNTPEESRDLMRLTMFPQETAQKIATQSVAGEFRIEQIVGHARDLEHGQNFVDRVNGRIADGGKLDTATLDKLAEKAKVSKQESSNFIRRAPDAQRSAMLIKSANLSSLSSFADKMNDASQIILDRFAPDRTIVLLGRDMNPFTPVLRAHGRDVIDFHYSSLQHGDPSTVERWLKEVPPNSVVIDSKLRGTIHDSIRQFDPSIEPYLLQSKTAYPQLLPNTQLRALADHLEVFPKMTWRCSGFRPSGAAICKIRIRDDGDALIPAPQAARWNRALLQEMNLSDWYVWRYQNFTAVPQAERLGISAPSAIDKHLTDVAQKRSGT